MLNQIGEFVSKLVHAVLRSRNAGVIVELHLLHGEVIIASGSR
jgi:hypothetical protein